ncbi:MAG: c-type cytochrome domain-containing protein, partial [Planctomycetaceae bacterium]|nr:c-type cytochrome domain-containing protein [Planctomycetaceae bacterium]
MIHPVLIVTAALLSTSLSAAELPPAATHPVDYARDIQPLLQQRCLGCHNGDKQRGGLRLDRANAALKGGESLG